MNQDDQHLLDELKYNIDRSDQIKAITLTTHLKERSEELHEKFVEMLMQADFSFASLVLSYAIRAGSGQIFVDAFLDGYRANTAGELLRRKLRESQDEEIEVLLEVLDNEVFENCAWELVDILRRDTTKNILVLTIDRIGSLRFVGAIDELTELMYSLDKHLIARSIRALGMMKTSLAAERLGKRLGKESQLDLLILKTLSKFPSEDAVSQFSQALLLNAALPRNFAKSKLIDLRKAALPTLQENLQSEVSDLLIHSLDIIGEIGNPVMVRPIIDLLATGPTDPNVRFAAYQSLGLLAADADLRYLAAGLHDPVETVRFAAAFAIEGNYSQAVSTGITNMLNSDPTILDNIVRLVLDCRLPKLFGDVIAHEIASRIALAILKKNADDEQWEFFRDQLIELGRDDLIQKVQEARPDGHASEEKLHLTAITPVKVWAIDDSQMILMAYRSQLESLGCQVQVYADPVQAIEAFANVDETTQPDLIFTDLNMPGLTGIELTTRIRHSYSSYELPVILVTTQKNQDDYSSAIAAGVNEILNKPFTKEMLKEILNLYEVQEVDL